LVIQSMIIKSKLLFLLTFLRILSVKNSLWMILLFPCTGNAMEVTAIFFGEGVEIVGAEHLHVVKPNLSPIQDIQDLQKTIFLHPQQIFTIGLDEIVTAPLTLQSSSEPINKEPLFTQTSSSKPHLTSTKEVKTALKYNQKNNCYFKNKSITRGHLRFDLHSTSSLFTWVINPTQELKKNREQSYFFFSDPLANPINKNKEVVFLLIPQQTTIYNTYSSEALFGRPPPQAI
jgi:hypothetical protein